MKFKHRVQPIYIQRNGRVEFLLENHIHSHIQRLLFPLTLLQYLVFPKYNIRYNFITSNDLTTNIKWGCYTMILVILHIKCTLLKFIEMIVQVNILLNYNLFFIYTVYCICFVCNAVVVVLQSEIDVELVINLQIIESCLKTFKVEQGGVITNWIYGLLIVLFYATYTSIQVKLVKEPNFISFLVVCIIVMTFDLNLVYIVRVLSYLRKQIDVWKLYLKFVSEFRVKATNEHEEELTRNNQWKNLTKAYVAIANAYLICEKITQFPIIFYVLVTCVQFFIYVQILISSSNAKMVQIVSLVWTVKNSFLLTLISWECEKVYMTLKNARIACRLYLTENDDEAAEIEARQYLRHIIREEHLPFSARGLFTVNAVLPLKVLSIIVTYTVVILQFNFL